jgi:hypothetical protein
MRFDVDVRDDATTGGWKVTVTPAGRDSYATRHLIRSAPPPGLGFPQPNPHTPLAVGAGAGLLVQVDALCTAKAPTELAARLQALWSGPVPRSDQEIFGRYLFATLLGGDWATMAKAAAAADNFIDLVLRLPPDPRGALAPIPAVLHRLPWELMHGPDGFLAESVRPGVSIVREVRNAPPFPARRQIEPVVLFVIGGDPKQDDQIRAGYEFIGLIRLLQKNSLDMQRRVLVPATRDDIERAIQDFDPSIVHFITHGGYGANGGFIELTKPNGGGKDPCYLQDLLKPLKNARGDLPSVVVLNACRTAGADEAGPFAANQRAIPLAVELVNHGLPIVVGMAGDVADGASRLFTRTFYESLLTKASFARAAAEGRHAALKLWQNAAGGIDWAMPVLYQAPQTPPTIELDRKWLSEHLFRFETARGYRDIQSLPRSFCDRLDILESKFPEVANPSGTLRGLAITVPPSTQKENDKPRKLGKTWLLSEIASRAIRDGHIVLRILGGKLATTPVPNTLGELADAVLREIGAVQASRNLEFFAGGGVLESVRAALEGQAVALPDWVKFWQPFLKTQQVTNRAKFDENPLVVATALRRDIEALVAQVREQRMEWARPSKREGDIDTFAAQVRAPIVWLLFYDAHVLTTVAKYFADDRFFGSNAPLFKSEESPSPVRVALSFRTGTAVSGDQMYQAPVEFLNAFVNRNYIVREDLQTFPAPAVDLLPYAQFFLRYKVERGVLDAVQEFKGLAIKTKPSSGDPKGMWELFLRQLDAIFEGVPSRLEKPSEDERRAQFLQTHTLENLGCLVPANDEDALNLVRGVVGNK